MESILKVGIINTNINKHRLEMETGKIFKFKLLWILLNFQIFENVPDIFPARRVVTDIAQLSEN